MRLEGLVFCRKHKIGKIHILICRSRKVTASDMVECQYMVTVVKLAGSAWCTDVVCVARPQHGGRSPSIWGTGVGGRTITTANMYGCSPETVLLQAIYA